MNFHTWHGSENIVDLKFSLPADLSFRSQKVIDSPRRRKAGAGRRVAAALRLRADGDVQMEWKSVDAVAA